MSKGRYALHEVVACDATKILQHNFFAIVSQIYA